MGHLPANHREAAHAPEGKSASPDLPGPQGSNRGQSQHPNSIDRVETSQPLPGLKSRQAQILQLEFEGLPVDLALGNQHLLFLLEIFHSNDSNQTRSFLSSLNVCPKGVRFNKFLMLKYANTAPPAYSNAKTPAT